MSILHLSQQNWTSHITQASQKTKISQLYRKILSTKAKWIKSFQQSIELWMNFMYLKTQSSIQDSNVASKNNQMQKNKFVQFESNINCLVFETQSLVLKGLKNLQKLYMVPQLKQKSTQFQKQSQNKSRSKSKNTEKCRSSSLTSFNRNRKTSLFSNNFTKPNVQSSFTKTNSVGPSQNFSRFMKQNNCYITKHQRQKPKYSKGNDQFKPFNSTLPAQSKISDNSITVVDPFCRTASDYFKDKQNRLQKDIVQKVTNKIDQKIKNIQCGVNEKLNKIIQTLEQSKSVVKMQQNQPSRFPLSQNNQSLSVSRYQQKLNVQGKNPSLKRLSNSHQQSIKQFTQSKLMSSRGQKIPSSQIISSRQPIKRNSMVKKCISNPIREQFENQNDFEIIQIDTTKQNKQTNNLKDKQQISTALNKINQKTKQKVLKQFVKSIIKIPISQSVFEILASQYLYFCNKLELQQQIVKVIPQNTVKVNKNIIKKTKQQEKLQLKKILNQLYKFVDVIIKNKKQQMMFPLLNFSQKLIICIHQLMFNEQHLLNLQENEQDRLGLIKKQINCLLNKL